MIDIDLVRDIPGYRFILKALLRSQILSLVDQLSELTGEESVVMTASVSDGTFCHLGSGDGKDFLDGRDEVKTDFLKHCLRKQQLKKSSGHLEGREHNKRTQSGYPSEPVKPLKNVPSCDRAEPGKSIRVNVVESYDDDDNEAVCDDDGGGGGVERVSMENEQRAEWVMEGGQTDGHEQKQRSTESGHNGSVRRLTRSLDGDKSSSEFQGQAVKLVGTLDEHVTVARATEKEGVGGDTDGERSSKRQRLEEKGEVTPDQPIGAGSSHTSVNHDKGTTTKKFPWQQNTKPWKKAKFMGRRKMATYTLEKKYQALTNLETGAQNRMEIMRDYKISASTLSTWLKNADSIKSGYCKFSPNRKCVREGKWKVIDKGLMDWFLAARERGEIVTGMSLIDKAKEIALENQVTNFQGSSGWLDRFKNRHGIMATRVSMVTEEGTEKSYRTLGRIHGLSETGVVQEVLESKCGDSFDTVGEASADCAGWELETSHNTDVTNTGLENRCNGYEDSGNAGVDVNQTKSHSERSVVIKEEPAF